VRIVFFTSISVLLLVLRSFGKLSSTNPINNSTTSYLPFKSTVHSLLGTALGLLLVYRTNSAYDRFWEGRKLWAALTSTSLDLVRCVKAWEQTNVNLMELVNLLICYSICMKQRMRQNINESKYSSYLSINQQQYLKSNFNDIPNALTYMMTDWVFVNCKTVCSSPGRTSRVDGCISNLVATQAGMERLLDTGIPISYVGHCNQLVFFYLLTLPFCILDDLGWFGIPMMALMSFGLIGIEEAGAEIEFPFGHDVNDVAIHSIIERNNFTLKKMASTEYSVGATNETNKLI